MSEDTTKKFDNQPNGRLDQLFVMVQSMRSELAELKQTVDTRLYDTRPIWEKVQVDITQLQEGQNSLSEEVKSLSENQKRFEERQHRFEERLEAVRDETRTGFRDLKRQFAVLYEAFFEGRADYKDLDNRVYKLETERDGSL
jgi:chromosome segregation ATPase